MIFTRYSPIGLLFRGTRHLQSLAEENNNVKYISKYLNICESKAQYLSMKHPIITKLSEEKIKTLIDTLNELGLRNESIEKEPALFGFLPITLKYRFKVLKECGIEDVTCRLLTTYLTILRQKTIGELKMSHMIPAHVNVENRLASHMTQWPTSLTTLIYGDVNDTTLYSLRLKIIQRYLELVLDLSNEEFNRGVTTYPTIKHRPLEYINETLKILQSKIMIPNHKIKSNLYLIHADPENLMKILTEFQAIGGIDIKEVIRLHPKLAIKNYKTLIDIKKILTEYNISNDAQRRCFDIYTLGPETIRERLEKAKKIPEFNVFFEHPRFLKMIHYNKTAMKRVSKLYEYNKKCLSLNILSGSSAHYNVFEKAPGDRLGKGKDLLFCISQSLGKQYTTTDVKKIIKRHPFWINTPVLQVKYVFEQLCLQFTHKDIYENCPILLYPWKKIREILNLLNKGRLHEQLPLFHENFDLNILSDSQKLSLVLYVLEKKHYFSGNGVWSEDRNKNAEKEKYQSPIQIGK